MTESKPSKSARKREQLALQRLGERLLELSVEELEAVPMDDALRDALRTAKRIRAHGALRRHKRLIGKLMRQNDADAIRANLEAVTGRAAADKRLFARAERWRDRIVDEGAAGVNAFRRETECDDRDLHGLVTELGRATTERARRAVRRRIFRAINGVLVAQRTGDRIPQ